MIPPVHAAAAARFERPGGNTEGTGGLRLDEVLQAYFRTGWAFLLPYLGLYLFFGWQGWSVPTLVRLFQLLHVFHLAAFGAVWIRRCLTAAPHGVHRRGSFVWSLVPWGLLALLLHIPGVYLEMPADPWAHLARVNDWSHIVTPFANPEWKKSGSLLVFSLVEPWGSAGAKLSAFGLCATAFSLLYHWQYYLLVRACGLSHPVAWCAIVANFLLFGNNLFGFHRYYGMSTTVLAQIAVLAVTRHAVMAAARASRPTAGWASWGVYAARSGVLLVLIAFNHVQGLALAVMALAAVWAWHFVGGSRRRQFWAVLALVGVNLLVVLFRPQAPDAAQIYQANGWLNAWYGFDLLDFHSPAFERAGQIFGLLGMFNLLAAVCIARQRPIAAWLTLLPIAFLLSPVAGIVFANAVQRFGPAGYEYIPSFNRLFLGIPSGLALTCLLAALARALERSRRPQWSAPLGFAALALSLLVFTTLPASAPFYNRLWHDFARVPNDLQMTHVTAVVDSRLLKNAAGPRHGTPPFYVLATPGTGFVLSAFGETSVPFRNKWMLYPTLSTPVNRLHSVELALKPFIQRHQPGVLVVPAPASLFTATSQAGYLSGHWLANQVALEQAGAAELAQAVAPWHTLRSEQHGVWIFGSN